MVLGKRIEITKETYLQGNTKPLLHRRRVGLRRTTKNTAGKLTGRMVSSVRPMVTTERDAPSAAARTPRLAARARERPAAAVLRLAARSDMALEMEETASGFGLSFR